MSCVCEFDWRLMSDKVANIDCPDWDKRYLYNLISPIKSKHVHIGEIDGHNSLVKGKRERKRPWRRLVFGLNA